MKKSVFKNFEEENMAAETQNETPNSQENLSEDAKVSQDEGESTNSQALQEGLVLPNSDALLAQVTDLKDKYLRAVAELENVKKRAVKERSELQKYAAENLGRDLLEIVDNFTLAFSQKTEGVNEVFLKGFKLIHDRLSSILEKHSIRGEDALGLQFDPNKHQALASVPTAEKPAGTILEQYKRAYFIKDKLLRPAQVVVAIEPPKEDENNS